MGTIPLCVPACTSQPGPNPASRPCAPISTVRPMSCRSQPRVFWFPRPYPSMSQCPRGCHRGLTWHNPFEPAVPPGTDFAHAASFNCHLAPAVRLVCVADTCPATTASRREASGPSGDLLGPARKPVPSTFRWVAGDFLQVGDVPKARGSSHIVGAASPGAGRPPATPRGNPFLSPLRSFRPSTPRAIAAAREYGHKKRMESKPSPFAACGRSVVATPPRGCFP